MAQKILIAGGSGFIGSHIAQELSKTQKGIRILCRHPEEAQKKLHGIKAEFVEGDVRNPESLLKALENISTVINCVQFPNHPIENPSKGYTYEKFDGQGTRNLVRAAKQAGTVNRIIYLSGAGVRQERPNLAKEPWFRAKLVAEHAIIESGIPYTIFRPSWVYGPEDRSLNRFLGFAQNLPFIPVIGNGKNKVQPLFVDDLAKFVALSIENSRSINQIYEVGGPEILTMDDIIKTLLNVAEKSKPIVHHPSWFVKIASTPMQLLSTPPMTPGAVDFLTMEELVDSSKAINDLGIQPMSLRDALKSYLKKSKSAAA